MDEHDHTPPIHILAVLAEASSPAPSALLGPLASADVVWWEVNRLRRGGWWRPPGRLIRYLARAGFDMATVYWAKGGHERCTMYLPLDGGQASRWYFGAVLRAPALLRWTLVGGARLVSALAPRAIGGFVPEYGVVAWRRGAEPPTPGMLAAATEVGAIAPTAESALLLYGEGAWSRVVHVPFVGGTMKPVAAVKHPRVSRFNDETAHERATLLALRERLGEEMRDSVPRPTATFEAAGLRVVVEEWVSGRPMFGGRRGNRRGKAARADLRGAAGWLRRFHQRTADGAVPVAELIPNLVDAPAAAYLAHVGRTPAERSLLERLRAVAAASGELSLPLVMEHRDFGPWNIYRTSAGIVVIDWEVAERGFPLCDLLYFGMHWSWITGRVKGREDEVRALRNLLLPPFGDPLSRAVRVEIDRYLSELRVDSALVPVLLVHMLVRQAVDVVVRRAGEGRSPHLRENRYADYVRALAEHADELFSAASVPSGGSRS